MSRRAVYFVLAAATLVTGLTVRFAPLGLPRVMVKYGGSTLWAAMIYWALVIASPKTRPVTLASIACAIAVILELQRLYHAAWLDTFRMSLPGVLLLGRFFSIWDTAAYWLAIIVFAMLDAQTIRRVVRC